MADDVEGNDNGGGPSIPAGVLRASKRHRGWAGEELEMEHHRSNKRTKGGFAAVDIKQFQNIEVGAGYQARGVIRQKTSSAVQGVAVLDMTTRNKAVDRNSMERKLPRETEAKETKRLRLEKYISCEGLREFRKEIEHLLAPHDTVLVPELQSQSTSN
jgi:hypothetical protein